METAPILERASLAHRLAPALLLALLAWSLGGCAMNRYDKPRPGTSQRGIASWYGEPFHGRKTASGEVYDMHQLTAAHRELPLGTIVDVQNLENGRRVRVKVNDRGPFVRGRVLDLSYEAARQIGMIGPGTAKIELVVVRLGGGPSGATLTTRFTLQVGAYESRENAEAMRAKLAADFTDVRIVTEGRWHRVRVGDLRTERDAEELRAELRRHGYPALVVRLN